MKFRPGVPARTALEAARSLSGRRLKSLPGIGVEHWQLGAGVSVERSLAQVARSPFRGAIEYAEPNYIIRATEIPDDTKRGDLWGLHNVGQTPGPQDADVDWLEAWSAGIRGSANVVVAVIDTGVDYNHPDVAANILRDANGVVGFDFANNDADPMDDNNHGTHVAGTIGAVANNGLGVAGVCPNVRIMPLKFLGAGGSGDTADAIDCVNWAAAHGAQIMNASWGSAQSSKSLKNAIANSGRLFVAAAGNGATSDPFYPAAFNLANQLTAGATDWTDNLAGYSNFGSYVHLAAPGSSILSTIRNGGYARFSGTSMASPHVAGAAALLLAQNPTWGYGQLRSQLLDTVDVLPSLAGKVTSSGRLNVARAVGAGPLAEDTIGPAAISDLAAGSPAHDTATLTWTATGDDGSAGAAYLVDLRRRTDGPLDETNWATASVLVGLPKPQAAGTAETATLALNLSPGWHYFGMRAVDEAGNPSPIANAALFIPGSGWTTSLVDEDGGYYLSHTYDRNGKASVAYTDIVQNFVKFARFNGVPWDIETIGPGRRGMGLAFGLDNTPWVSSSEYLGWGPGYDMKVASKNAVTGAWETGVLENRGVSTESSSLAVSELGEVGLAYRKDGLKFAKRVNGAWTIQTVARNAGARYFSMAYNPTTDRPAIAFSDDVNPADGYLDTLKFAEWNGSQWAIQTIETGVVGYGVFTSLAWDPVSGDWAVIHKVSTSGGQIRFLRRSGTTWQPAETVALGAGDSCSLTFRADGTAFVAYSGGGDLHLATQPPGGGWSSEIAEYDVDGYWSVPVAIDPANGLPSISYRWRYDGSTDKHNLGFSHK